MKAQLKHLAIVSWAVPRKRIAAMLPRALEPTPIDPEGNWAIFSMAVMWDATLGETYTQVNERVYVRRKDGTGEGAYFWKSHANSSQAELFHWLLGIPEFHDDVELTVPGGTYACTFDRNAILEFEIPKPRIRDDKDPNPVQIEVPERYRGLNIDVQRAWDLSKNPMLGYTLDWGELFVTPVKHNTIVGDPVPGVKVDPSFMVPSITLDPGQGSMPIFTAYQPATPFFISLPPRPVGGWCALAARVFYPLRT